MIADILNQLNKLKESVADSPTKARIDGVIDSLTKKTDAVDTVKDRDKEIDDLKKRVADLTTQLEARAAEVKTQTAKLDEALAKVLKLENEKKAQMEASKDIPKPAVPIATPTGTKL